VACFSLLQACGIRSAPVRLVDSREEATLAARELGYPVVLKGSGPALVHKTEAHAVITDLADETAMLPAFDSLKGRADVHDILIQPMVESGVEMLVGASFDPTFGHVIVCGSGGTQVELLRDMACRLAPLTDVTTGQMLDEVRGAALLRGFRGRPRADEAGLREIVLRISELVTVCPGILEIDLNPVIVTPHHSVVVDARIRVLAGSS